MPFARPVQVALATGSNFIKIEGSQFVMNGRQVVIKGSNYYQRNAPWAEMWKQWYGPQVAHEVTAGAKELGINTLRILVPYGHSHDWNQADSGEVYPEMLNRLQQMVQIAGQQGMKVILTLFDFYDNWPAAGSAEESANLKYLATIINTFKDDDRILAWDIHNEPDNYNHWQQDRRPDEVIDWLERMVNATRHLDANHLITIGPGDYRNYWLDVKPGSGRPLMIDMVDFVSFHTYEAPNMLSQVQDIKSRTAKPILLEEAGWPSFPAYLHSTYNEQDQSWFYQRMVEVVQSEKLTGAIQWMLWDFTAGKLVRPTDQTDWMGLFRWDSSLKPAGQILAGWKVNPLASATNSSLSLTGVPAATDQIPLFFPSTNHFIAAEFKQLWQQQAGLEQFGLPLTEAFTEQEHTVQIFERVIMEFWSEARSEPGFYKLPLAEQLKRVVKLRRLGAQVTLETGRDFPPGVPFESSIDRLYFPQTGYSLSNGFLSYWQGHGGLLQYGFPISEEIEEISRTDGQKYTVQYFERARFEYHPEDKGTSYEVLLGQLGREEMIKRGWIL